MSEYLEALIFDRVQADVDNLRNKAYIDYGDLNRIENAVKWVSYVLNKYGYQKHGNHKTIGLMLRWNVYIKISLLSGQLITHLKVPRLLQIKLHIRQFIRPMP